MKKTAKKLISIMLAILMSASVLPFSVMANAGTPTVTIVSFMRGEQTDLRSSELLEARVEGYDGNVLELTYRWTSTLGTYLYVYNSHNMYNINNTDGEVEVYNKSKLSGSENMIGRTYPDSFSGKGYAWASVYGANLSSTALIGELRVDVLDENGNVLCSDTHTGKYSNRRNSGFVTYNLDADMDNVVIGLFEGDKRNVKDLLGESAILHITCVESKVNDGKIVEGADHIVLTKESDGNYYITGSNAGTSTDSSGDAKVQLIIKKENCKFHNKSQGDAITTVFVFRKPTTETTTTTLTLTGNLDSRCEYFIKGVKGELVDGKIVFTGLTPNTAYTVEVRATYKDAKNNDKYAYAYVYDTTKPVYNATIHTYLDNALTDIGDIHGEDVELYLHEDNENAAYIALTRTDIGTYTATVENGRYLAWHKEGNDHDHEHKAREYKLIIENANGELHLHHYSVTYNAAGGAFESGETSTKKVHPAFDAVNATDVIPAREGYSFAGWSMAGSVYSAGAQITSSLNEPLTLNAVWEKAVNATINVVIDHTSATGGYDHNADRDDLVVNFLEMTKDSPAFIETGDKLIFDINGVTDEPGNKMHYDCEEEKLNGVVLKTTYTATDVTYSGLLESSTFGVTVSKTHYNVECIEKTQDEKGDWTINIVLKYRPDSFNLDFSVKMEDGLPEELYPEAVIVKIACWDSAANEWIIISQQRNTEYTQRPGVRVDIDENGTGSGSYPVWIKDSSNNLYGYRAVVTGFIYKDSTIVVPSEKDHIKDENTVIVAYTDGNYTATMGNVADGMLYSTSLYGAYYNETDKKQQGTLDAVISVEKYDVIFDAQGGAINSAATYVVSDQYYIPELSSYVPVMEDHNFLGWYLDRDYNEAAASGVLLTSDVTLYAKWDRVLTGSVIVDGYFNTSTPVNKEDRATHALIELEEVIGDESYNIKGTVVEINWPADKHFSDPVSYKFTGLSPDKEYRVDVYLVNYEAAYQNSSTVINGNGDIHDDYNEADFMAVYTDEKPLETFVNIFLHFEPEPYAQPVVVDATRIGEGFRPGNVVVQYSYSVTGSGNEFRKIIQHNEEPFGVNVKIDAETGLNNEKCSEDVWKKDYNGNLYDYQGTVVSVDGGDVSELPVLVVYGEPARWSPANMAPTSDIQVTLIPLWYDIVFDWNIGEGETNIIETVSRGHIWSHETQISYVPTDEDGNLYERTGYVFKGWTDKNGNAVTKIDASVHEDTILYAKWEKVTDCTLTVNHILVNTGDVFASEIISGLTFGVVKSASDYIKSSSIFDYEHSDVNDVTITTGNNIINIYYSLNSFPYSVSYLERETGVALKNFEQGNAIYGTTVTKEAVAIEGYALDADSSVSVVITETANNIVFWYSADKIGGGNDGNTADNIPDKYQKKVVFEVVNGTWKDNSTEVIETYLTLIKDGKWDESGSARLTAPTGMKASDGFGNGKWISSVPSYVSGTATVTYTYVFTELVTPENPDGSGSNDENNGEIKNYVVFGKTDGIGWYNVSLDGGQTYSIVFGNSTVEVPVGTQMIVKVGDLMGDTFRFYVNGQAVEPDENGNLVVTVEGYMLIGALGYNIQVPDVEESLNFFQKIIKAIKDFFDMIAGWFK